MVHPTLLPLMRTPRLPVVDRTDAPAELNGLVRFAERWNVVSARVPSHFKRSLYVGAVVLGGGKKCMRNKVRDIAYIRVDDTKLALWTDRHVGQVRYLVGNSSFGFKKNRIDRNLIYHWIIPQMVKDY